MRIPSLWLATPLALVLLAGCASGGIAAREGGARSQNVIESEQIEATNHQTAYEVVRSLRPAWLRDRPRSVTNPDASEVAVYVDGVRVGGISALAQVRAQNIDRMEFMSPSDATTRYGTGHSGGAILIMTRRG